ncbi:MAG: hypothetical protein NZ455_07790 [Bacteroidia bacterium]|nr:hypothetical protein [Bacteroidia bacterium]MDW8347694.1 hypothetical protein [Bacteroidia bacterium]
MGRSTEAQRSPQHADPKRSEGHAHKKIKPHNHIIEKPHSQKICYTFNQYVNLTTNALFLTARFCVA